MGINDNDLYEINKDVIEKLRQMYFHMKDNFINYMSEEEFIDYWYLDFCKNIKLNNKEIEELAESIANDISIEDCWQTRYEVAFNKIHEKYGI